MIEATRFRFTWVFPPYLGLGVALVAGPACGTADNDGDLDVLSALSHPSDASEAGAVPHEASDSSNCASETVACRTCIAVTMCLAAWLDCLADGQCMRADTTDTSCLCNAQLGDGGAMTSCHTAFRATGTQAAALIDCTLSRCALECGL